MSIELKLGTVIGQMESLSEDIGDIKKTITAVRDTQIDHGHHIKSLSSRMDKLEPIVTEHEDIRKYSKGAILGMTVSSGVVGGIVTQYAKPVLAMIGMLFK